MLPNLYKSIAAKRGLEARFTVLPDFLTTEAPRAQRNSEWISPCSRWLCGSNLLCRCDSCRLFGAEQQVLAAQEIPGERQADGAELRQFDRQPRPVVSEQHDDPGDGQADQRQDREGEEADRVVLQRR